MPFHRSGLRARGLASLVVGFLGAAGGCNSSSAIIETAGPVPSSGAGGNSGSTGGSGTAGDGMGGGTITVGTGGESGTGGGGGARNGDWIAALRLGGMTEDGAWGMSPLADGTVYLTGKFTGTVPFGSTTLVSTPQCPANCDDLGDIFIAKYDASGNAVWAKSAGGPKADAALSVAADNEGSVYVAGSFAGTATFGSTTVTSSGMSAGFLAKYDSSGEVLWVTTADSIGPSHVSVLADGSAYAVGSFYGNRTIGSTMLSAVGEDSDGFWARYDAKGNVVRAGSFGGTGADNAAAVAAGADGSAYVAGSFSGSATFGTTTLTASGPRDALLLKYDSSGSVLWARQGGGEGFDYADSVAVLGDGSAYVAGVFSGTASFGSENLATSSQTASTVFIVKYDPDGNVAWARKWKEDGVGSSLVGLLADGSSYLAGQITLGVKGLVLAKYESSGNLLWAEMVDVGSVVTSPNGIRPYALGVLGNGSVYVAGDFRGLVAFGGLPVLMSKGVHDGFLAAWR